MRFGLRGEDVVNTVSRQKALQFLFSPTGLDDVFEASQSFRLHRLEGRGTIAVKPRQQLGDFWLVRHRMVRISLF